MYYFTKEQDAYLVLDNGENGRTIVITYDTVQGFDVIHTYLRNPDERITLANSLARAVIPIYVTVDIPYMQVAGQPLLDKELAKQTVVNFIDTLDNSKELNIDSLIREIHLSYGQQIIIQNPLLLKGVVYYPNGTKQEFYSENVLSVPEFKALGVTNRLCGYYTSTKYISFTERT